MNENWTFMEWVFKYFSNQPFFMKCGVVIIKPLDDLSEVVSTPHVKSHALIGSIYAVTPINLTYSKNMEKFSMNVKHKLL